MVFKLYSNTGRPKIFEKRVLNTRKSIWNTITTQYHFTTLNKTEQTFERAPFYITNVRIKRTGDVRNIIGVKSFKIV